MHVLSEQEHVRDSPFVLMVSPFSPEISPTAVRVLGLDTNNAIVTRNTPVLFQIDASEGGSSSIVPQAMVVDKKGLALPVSIRAREDGANYDCTFTPCERGKHSVLVSYAGVSVPGSPFTVS